MADPVIIVDASGSGAPPEIRPATPEEQAAMDAEGAAAHAANRARQFETSEDAERLALVNERARADPAYAALADFVLRGVSR